MSCCPGKSPLDDCMPDVPAPRKFPRVETSFRRIARASGGLFVGIRISFPQGMMLCEHSGHQHFSIRCTEMDFSLGLLLWKFSVAVRWGFTPYVLPIFYARRIDAVPHS